MKYIKGDLFNFITPNTIIPHVCNNAGAMSAGFVVPLCRRYPVVKIEYTSSKLDLGDTQFINVEPDVYVANMIAQTLYDRPRPLRYDALVYCMEDVALDVEFNNLKILAPKFGSELAGGNWEFIECLIEDIWEGLDVTIVEYQK